MRIDAEIAIGVGRVPPRRVGNMALCYAACDHVAGVERQLGLREGCRNGIADSDERIVRRDNNVRATHGVAVGTNGKRLIAKLVGCSVLENLQAFMIRRTGESGEIRSRMYAHLP